MSRISFAPLAFVAISLFGMSCCPNRAATRIPAAPATQPDTQPATRRALRLATRPATRPASRPMQTFGTYPLSDVRMRDVCILPDPATQTYYMVGPARRGVRIYTSKDLRTWTGPTVIYRAPADVWGDIPIQGIWAPEMQIYKGKYYLFLTFSTDVLMSEQWPNWRPRVIRGSTILASDAPTGPFTPFQNRSTPPTDMMTLDGTLWVEDGVPYMVYCHEWVQIKDGTVESIKLKDDLSAADGEPKLLFHASDARWSEKSLPEGGRVTDGPYLKFSKSGKLFMIWSSFNNEKYTTGLAVSESGKLAGPWVQQPEPLFKDHGGHGMLFTTFDGKLMMVLHAPNTPDARPRVFELEDTGDTLRMVGEFIGTAPASAPD